jgi:hypothetical protein
MLLGVKHFPSISCKKQILLKLDAMHTVKPTHYSPKLPTTNVVLTVRCHWDIFTAKKIMQKRITTTFLLAMGTLCATAQNCKNYLLLQNNKRVEMTVYNRKGKEDGKQVWMISNVKNAGKTTTATINTEFFSGKGKSINKSTSQVQCNGGSLQMSMKLMMGEAQLKQMNNATAKASGEFIDYPANIKEGDNLPDGNMQIDYTMEGGMTASIEISVTGRSVGGKESITSPAGTWECYKITSNQKIISKVAGIGIPIKMEVTEWYAPGVGVIKTESKYGSTLITAIQ